MKDIVAIGFVGGITNDRRNPTTCHPSLIETKMYDPEVTADITSITTAKKILTATYSTAYSDATSGRLSFKYTISNCDVFVFSGLIVLANTWCDACKTCTNARFDTD